MEGSTEKIARLEALSGPERGEYEADLRIRVPGMGTPEEEIKDIKTNNIRLRIEFRKAQAVVRNLDPAIGKARKELKAKYPMEDRESSGFIEEELEFV